MIRQHFPLAGPVPATRQPWYVRISAVGKHCLAGNDQRDGQSAVPVLRVGHAVCGGIGLPQPDVQPLGMGTTDLLELVVQHRATGAVLRQRELLRRTLHHRHRRWFSCGLLTRHVVVGPIGDRLPRLFSASGLSDHDLPRRRREVRDGGHPVTRWLGSQRSAASSAGAYLSGHQSCRQGTQRREHSS
jgi:hypothetical protein